MSRRNIAVFVLGFFALWILAWVLHDNAERYLPRHLAANTISDTVFWLLAKLLIWIAFPVLYFRGRIAEPVSFLGLTSARAQRGLLAGAAVSLVWLALSADLVRLRQQHLVLPTDAILFVYASVITPIIEEFLFRGYIQSGLVALGTRFYAANIATTVLFVLAHCVGWWFQEILVANLMSARIFSLVALSLVMGYVRHRTGSLWGSITLHMSNNAFSFAVTN